MKYFFSLGIFLFFLFIFLNGLFKDPKIVPSNLINQEVPNFDSVAVLSKKKFNQEFLREDNRIKIVNFFASWCPPCKVEHPQLQYFSKKKDLSVLGINKKDESRDLEKFLKELGDPFEAIISDLDGKVGIQWGVYALPESFIIDKEGKIRYKHIGPIMKRDLIVLDKIINNLRNE